tara:strand:- start:753 stop:1097 length:345 start_codon:yes stop_codon:yes gene_type:complete
MIEINNDKEVFIVLTTEANFEKAEYLCHKILVTRLAACVNFKEVESHFWWEGKLEHVKEVQLFVKTTKEKLSLLLEKIKEIHSYKNPEIILWKASASKAYMEWINEEINSKDAF